MTKRINLLLNQGATFYQIVELTDQNGDPVVMTYANGANVYSAAAQMRKSFYSSNSYAFVTATSNGQLTLSMDSNTTTLIPGGRYQYDVELTSNNSVVRVIEGAVLVRPEVTKT